MKHRKEIIITIIITTTICFVAIPLGVNYAFHHVAPVDILAARWEASDTLYCQEWLQFLILLAAEFGCFALIFMGALIVEAAERFNGWVAGL
mgnify:CR=1 FL=1